MYCGTHTVVLKRLNLELFVFTRVSMCIGLMHRRESQKRLSVRSISLVVVIIESPTLRYNITAIMFLCTILLLPLVHDASIYRPETVPRRTKSKKPHDLLLPVSVISVYCVCVFYTRIITNENKTKRTRQR